MKLEVGQRVQQTDEWMKGNGQWQRSRKHGVVTKADWPDYVRVRLDGRKSASQWHASFWELEQP